KNAKLDMLGNIRQFINNIAEFRNSKIIMSPRKISVENEDFFFGFRGDKKFNMGFTCGQEKIEFLNGVLNDITTRLSSKMASNETIEIDFFSTAEFPINKG